MDSQAFQDAPGAPGIPPTWTSSAKDMVGCTLGNSHVWFTLGFGIVNEVYYPRIDIPQIRDLGFIVADGKGFWAEVKRIERYSVRLVEPGVPAVEIVHDHERYTLRLRIAPDQRRDVLAVECRLEGDADLRLYALLAPRLGATGYDNSANVVPCRGRRILCAEQGPFGVALAAADEHQHDAFARVSAGYVGVSDGWQDFARHGAMTWEYPWARAGNVAMMGELPRYAVLALGFGSGGESAATLAVSSLMQPFDHLLKWQIAAWDAWHVGRRSLCPTQPKGPAAVEAQLLTSSVVLRSHIDKTYPGAMVASLSVPWGNRSDQRGGYHLVWPRDLVQCAVAILGFGAEEEARQTLRYLIATQREDGRWHQCQWLGGTPYWQRIQLDETGFPVLLAAALAERNALGEIEVRDMIRRALDYIARTGPSTEQDRWEENEGINPFTLAVCIAAFVTGAGFLDEPAKSWALALADFWNANVERWLTVRGSETGRRAGVARHYVRVAPPQVVEDRHALRDPISIRNRDGNAYTAAAEEIGTEFLQLVRFGLRSADDPLIRDSVRVVDAVLKTDTPCGPVWHRYNGDGYGEHEDGRPFNGAGIGRGWPLLTGERGHYELMAGADVLPYLEAMAAMTSPCGMMPEQVWDSGALPDRRLFPGRPSGSAMPLAWAHAEFIKLALSRELGYPADRPRAVWQRYQGKRRIADYAFWWPHAPIAGIPAGARLAVALPKPAVVHWGVDGWRDVADVATADSGLGFHVATLDIGALRAGNRVDFTWRWRDGGEWEHRDYRVIVAPAAKD